MRTDPSYRWAWHRVKYLSTYLPDELLDVILFFLGPQRYMEEKEILEMLGYHSTSQQRTCLFEDMDGCRRRIRVHPCNLFLHCDDSARASTILFGTPTTQGPPYLTTHTANEIWNEIRPFYVHAWTRIAFQKSIVRHTLHTPLLATSTFCIGLWTVNDPFRLYVSSTRQEVQHMVRTYRSGLVFSPPLVESSYLPR